MSPRKLLVATMCAMIPMTLSVQAQELNELSLEELLNVIIESVSNKAENLQDVASAIYVLTAEDLRRAGVIRIQDALRLVPGYWASDMSWGIASNGLRESATSIAGPCWCR